MPNRRLPVRVCHLTTTHSPTDSRIFWKECVSLANRGYEVHALFPDTEDRLENGVVIHGIDMPDSGRIGRRLIGGWRAAKRARAIKADVYHIHDPDLLPVAWWLKRRTNAAIIYDAHESFPDIVLAREWIPHWLRGTVSRVVRVFENVFAARTDAVITATPTIARRFQAFAEAAIVCNYPILREFAPDNHVPHRIDEKSVCYVGGISEERGICEMVAAAGIIGIRLKLAGSFHSETTRRKVTALDGWQLVDELGYLDRSGVYRTCAESTAGLVVLHPTPNHIASLPIKMFEYMASGIPVIASDFPLWREIIDQFECGLCVNPYDERGIAETIRWMVDRPDRAARMG
ncbi:MAG: glycosyltransferase family 4 protein, partial [Candidatus Poribacteria bacterium]|nr:glycosyltransferase family 4 protein [Candidatus Poribacteria bacterium]